MATQEFSKTDQPSNSDDKHVYSESEQLTAPQDEAGIMPMPNYTPSENNQSKTIIMQMNSKPGTSNAGKLKSLLPKNLLCLASKIEGSGNGDSFQVKNDPVIQVVNTLPSLSSGEIVVGQPANLSGQGVEMNTQVTTSEALETILQQLHSNFSATPVLDSEAVKSHSFMGQDGEKSNSLIPESLQSASETLPNYEPMAQQPVGEFHPMDSQVVPIPQSSSASQPDEHDTEQEVIKKTVVEAFVKMVVCRKVTVQKVSSKTGQVIDTKVKTEEEEPVILGVDCVETTEELMSSSAELTNDSSGADLVSPKWGASLDGGLKFLSAVSESRQKIGKGVKKDKLFRPASKDGDILSKFIEPENSKTVTAVSSSGKGYVVKASSKYPFDVKTETRSDSELEWNEEFNDDSEDYVPGRSKQGMKESVGKSQRGSARKLGKTSVVLNTGEISIKEEIDTVYGNHVSTVLLQKKRGRKRKWDNALGMASNLRTCQFCNKHFPSVLGCAKHMKKGKCVTSLLCFICLSPFKDETELEKHLLTHGSQPKLGVYKCKDCKRTYRTRAGYSKHFRSGTCFIRDDFEDGFTGDFKCDLCESRFSTDAYLRLHRYKVHENPNDTHTCPDCGKRFYSTQGFNKHRSGRPCTEPLKCRICGKSYSSKAKESFKIHMKHHKTEVAGITFECDECGRSYMTQMALTKHKLSHTGVKPYKCDICGKEFSMRYMVKDHARMHTGERPYLCSLCGSAFSNKGHLGRHLRSHENGTLLKRGRPKKIKDPDENSSQETELKMIDLGQTLQNFDGQTIQVVDGQMFESPSSGTPMIIQANNNTIIIAEGWPNASAASAITLPSSQNIVDVTASVTSSSGP